MITQIMILLLQVGTFISLSPFSLALNEQHSDILDLFVVLGIISLSSKEIGDLNGWISFLDVAVSFF